MTLGQRIEARRKAVGLRSQAELARSARVPQSTINTLINSDARWSPHLVRIAGALHTTVAYLTGEVDDPDKDAPPPPEPRLALITLPVALPSEAALARMFHGLLAPFELDREDELARTLARQLPKGLQRLAGPLVEEDGHGELHAEAVEARPSDRLAPRRATRT